MTGIVIPTLDEAKRIGRLIAALRDLEGEKDIVVADGGSSDGTAEIARAAGARVVLSPRGRGAQLQAGAAAARGDALWFVHADSRPEPGSLAAIEAALADPAAVGGDFRVVFDGGGRAARSMTWIYPKLRWLGLSYGDAGIFVRRPAYDACGGFQQRALFEDLDLLRRLRPHGRFVHLGHSIATSSRRFEGWNYPRAWAVWIALQSLYWAGVSPDVLAKLYRRAR